MTRDREELKSLVLRAQAGEDTAYGVLVQRFKGMAHSHAYKYLRDFHLAEDVVQEAFLEAYRCLPNLREPVAFPAWFRRIVFKHCDRATRGKRITVVSLDSAPELPARAASPSEVLEERQTRSRVLAKLRLLPPHERIVATLFYLNDYSQAEISDFLAIPISTVKNRLRASRIRLQTGKTSKSRRRLIQEVLDHRYSGDAIAELLAHPRPLEIRGHPVWQVWNTMRGALTEFDVVGGGEIEDRGDVLSEDEGAFLDFAFYLSRKKILRPNMLDVITKAISDRRPPLRLVAPGRVFQVLKDQNKWVNNDVDGVLAQRRIPLDEFTNKVSGIFKTLLGSKRLRWQRKEHPLASPYLQLCVPGGAELPPLFEGGMLKADFAKRIGLDPRQVSALAFGFHLEPISMLRHGISDRRHLWSAPYV